jgi:hypothetical protein
MYKTHLAEEASGLKTYGSDDATTLFKWKALDAGARAIHALDAVDIELFESLAADFEQLRQIHVRSGDLQSARACQSSVDAILRSTTILRDALVAIRETDRNNLPRA